MIRVKVVPVQAMEALRVARSSGSHSFRHSAHRWQHGINYMIDKQKHKDRIYKASLGNSAVEKLLLLATSHNKENHKDSKNKINNTSKQ
jgi:hypothetical protein